MPDGVVPPRILHTPPAVNYSSGDEAIALAESAGLELDEWQQYVLRLSLGERPDGRWASFEVALIVSRQNGKGAILEARELAGLFLFGERLILHSAHEFETSMRAFARIETLIENTPALRKRLKVRGISHSHGSEGVTLKTGQELRFKARTLRGGRGFSGDVVILDEAMYLQAASMNSLFPTMAARPNPQIWYVGSAVDRLEHPDGLTFSKVRDRGIAKSSPRLTLVEWSAPMPKPRRAGDEPRPEDVDPFDESLYPLGNPATQSGRITREYIVDEQAALSARGFAVERLGIGDWPREEETVHLIPPAVWASCIDEHSVVMDPVAFAADVTPDRKRASIAMACRLPDGRILNELIEDRDGVGWVAPRLLKLAKQWDPVAIVVDKNSPGASVIEALEKLGLEPTTTNSSEVAAATGNWLDDANEGRYAHRDDPIINDALNGATLRDLAGGKALDRKGTRPISALAACVLSRFGLVQADTTDAPPPPPQGVSNTDHTAHSGDLQTAGF